MATSFFPLVCKTEQHLALCCSCVSCYTGMTVQGGVLQQSSLLVILTQLVSAKSFECPQWSNSSRSTLNLTSIPIYVLTLLLQLQRLATSSQNKSLWSALHAEQAQCHQRAAQMFACMYIMALIAAWQSSTSPEIFSRHVRSSGCRAEASDFFIIQWCVEVCPH